jgi:hypothetical protein
MVLQKRDLLTVFIVVLCNKLPTRMFLSAVVQNYFSASDRRTTEHWRVMRDDAQSAHTLPPVVLKRRENIHRAPSPNTIRRR